MGYIKAMQNEASEKGQLQINVTSSVNSRPIGEAEISISYTGVPESTLERLTTDSSGQTEVIDLDAPPEEWSLNPENEQQPYSEYTFDISAPGFEPVSIAGAEILANVKAIQNVRMRPSDASRKEEEVFVIPAHTLYGEYPPKIAEDEIKPVNVDLSGYDEIVVAVPLWWSSMAAPMQTFLFHNGGDMAGKRIGLIVSSASRGISGVEADAGRLIPDGNFIEPSLWIRSSQTSDCHIMIEEWLNDTGIGGTGSMAVAVTESNGIA